MKQYTREEIIDELARNVGVSCKGYGTWKIKSYIGKRETYRYCAEHYIEVSEITHNEEDKIGIMNGEKYNPQDYNEWLYCEFDPELDANDCIANYSKEELKEKFEKYCESVWADSGNEDNYEPREERDKRLAEILLDALIVDDRVIECSNGNIVVLENREAEFLYDNFGWIEDLYEGKIYEFAEAFEEWEDEN